MNLSHNKIKFLPPELGSLVNLQYLYIESNDFTEFPCSFRDLINLKEFSLEWFKYMNPPLPQLVQKNINIGEAILDILRNTCKSLIKMDVYHCSFINFLKNFSENYHDLNQVDNR